MMDVSKPVERLGIKPYNWWNEALHGVARAGLATVFPQSIGMAASFNDSLVYEVFTAVSDEARAKNAYYASKGSYERYQGLTMWTPNVNIYRDPRWGRGIETYGEDPYLTTRMGVNVVKGLQGVNDGKYDKLHACAKHFAVHSGPEWNRQSASRRTYVIQKLGMELMVPRYHVYEDVPLRTDMRGDSSLIAFDYILDAGRTPIHSYCDLSIGLRHMPVADTTKYYIVQKAGKWRSSMGGKYANGWIKTRVRSLGTFSVDVDTIAPQITPIGQGGWRTSRNIRFRIKDMESGIGSYKVYIDGKFVLFGLKKGTLVIQDPEKVKKGVPHKLEVTVTDQCGNMTRKEYKF